MSEPIAGHYSHCLKYKNYPSLDECTCGASEPLPTGEVDYEEAYGEHYDTDWNS